MNYYDHTDEYNRRGIDYDLSACLEYNSAGFDVDEIDQVLAVWEGQNDGDDWRWVIRLKDGRYAFLQGGCDYTGWDCQSWATSEFATGPFAAAAYASGEGVRIGAGGGPEKAGFGHILNLLGGYGRNFNAVRKDLEKQLRTRKHQTWREMKDIEFKLAKGGRMKKTKKAIEDLGFDEASLKPYRSVYGKDNTIREFFHSQVPDDLYDDTAPDYQALMNDYAIYQAREMATTFRIPCNWEVLRWDGDTAIVVRTARLTQEEIDARSR